jgi:hypothetical protein
MVRTRMTGPTSKVWRAGEDASAAAATKAAHRAAARHHAPAAWAHAAAMRHATSQAARPHGQGAAMVMEVTSDGAGRRGGRRTAAVIGERNEK